MKLRLAVLALVNNVSIIPSTKYASGDPQNKHGHTVFLTNRKLPSIHSVSVSRTRSRAIAQRKSKCCQHCNRSTLINYNCLKSQITWQLSEIPYLVKELCKEPFFFFTLSQTTNFR